MKQSKGTILRRSLGPGPPHEPKPNRGWMLKKKCFESEIFVITQTKILKILKITLPNICPHIRSSKSI